MAGTSKAYDSTEIILGPADVWLNVAVPSAGARMTLHTDGTPDATANPNAVHLGMTAAGTTFSYAPEIQDFSSDELTAPHLSRIISETMKLEGEFLQVFDWAIIDAMTVGGTKNVNTSTTSGYEEETIGGLSSISTFSVALIGSDVGDSTLFWVVQLYSTYNKAGFNFSVTRKDQSKAKFEFTGLAITSRTAGDQIGNYWHESV